LEFLFAFRRWWHGFWRPTGNDLVPVHGSKEIATGTLNSILKQAGLK
jgi:predicted RNA binding protein YcfA (HicA-like mRNA interferase family)